MRYAEETIFDLCFSKGVVIFIQNSIKQKLSSLVVTAIKLNTLNHLRF